MFDVLYFCFVVEFSKPKVNISSNVTGSAAQTAELSCEVTGNPRPEISWLRNGEEIERSVMDRVDCEQYKSGFYEIKGEVVVEFGVLKSRLVMCSATHISQTGSYTCYANNSIGNDAATAYVNIYGTYRWFMVFVFFAYNNSNLILMRSLSPWSSNVSPG